MSLKDITDAEKPWFDYIGYLLRVAAWVLAIAYAAHQQFRPRPPGAGFPIFEWVGIFLAACFGVFLVKRLISMSLKMSREIIAGLKDTFFNRYVIAPFIMIWVTFGMPAFTIAVTGEFVELYLEKYVPVKAQVEVQRPATDFQRPDPLTGPWASPHFTRTCPSEAIISGTSTLCPIVPIQWY